MLKNKTLLASSTGPTIRGYSIVGTGIRLGSFEREQSDALVATLWLTLFFVPVIPLRRVRCRYLGESKMTHPHDETSPCFEILDRLPLSPFAILATWVLALVSIIAALAPIAFMLWFTNGRAANTYEVILALLAAAWPVAFLVILEKRRRRMLEATVSSRLEEPGSSAEARRAKAQQRLWRRAHALPRWVHLAFFGISAIPGFLFALWRGWGHEAAKLAGVATSCIGLGLTAGLDQWLIRRNRSKPLQSVSEAAARSDPSPESQRRSLLERYPTHLDMIDSLEIPAEYSKGVRRGPALSYYTESAKYYYDLIVASASYLKDATPGRSQAQIDADREMASIANNRIVNASWGLIARGSDAIPFAVQLLRSNDRDQREAAANVFAGLRQPERLASILPQIHRVLESERDRLVIDSLLSVLGTLRSRGSIPTIARFVLDEAEDPDTRDTAAASLGQIVRKTFHKPNTNPVRSACDWLADNGYVKQ
jgi:hypothetical protein